jgi:5-methylcytosine-specific restriction endonuclease McrA
MKCLFCGEELQPKEHGRKPSFCCRSHRDKWTHKNGLKKPPHNDVITKCKQCGKEFPSYSGSKRIYCSYTCAGKNKSHPDKLEKKVCIICGKSFDPHYKDKKLCSKQCLSIYNRKYLVPPKSREHIPTWQYAEWRKSVYERDEYTCQICGDSKGKNLRAHHLNSWDMFQDQRYLIDNGVTLCVVCHKAFHKSYGYGKNNEGQYEQFKTNYRNQTKCKSS